MGLTAPKSKNVCKTLCHNFLDMLEIIMGLKQRFLGMGFLFFSLQLLYKILVSLVRDSSLISADMLLLAVYGPLMSEPNIGLMPGLTLTCISLTWRSGTACEYYF